jgi:hypothetical protein
VNTARFKRPHPDLAKMFDAALANGDLVWKRGKLVCVRCGRSGYRDGSWFESCVINGHPYECGCGRKFSSNQSLKGHQRGGPNHTPCPQRKEPDHD